MGNSISTSKVTKQSTSALPGNVIRAARALLGWSQDALAEASDVTKKTIADIERGVTTNPQSRTAKALREALEAAGIEFLDNNGVRLRKP